MMSRDPEAYLRDMAIAEERISRFTAGRSFADYLGDDMLRSAVERQLEIIGEALAQLRRVDSALAAKVTDAPRIVAFRNRLIHGYHGVDDAVVWGTVIRDVPLLRDNLLRLRGSAG